MSSPQPYVLELSDHAKDVFKRLDKTIAQRIGSKLKWLAENAECSAGGFLDTTKSRYSRVVKGIRHEQETPQAYVRIQV